ncbi:MAG: response regulator [Planctomycetaceae bacterium]
MVCRHLHNILIVDDEPLWLNLLTRSMKISKLPYAVEQATSAQEALELLQHNEFEVLITDYRMPGIGGDQLLEEVQRLYPHMICIMLSATIEDLQPVFKDREWSYSRKMKT